MSSSMRCAAWATAGPRPIQRCDRVSIENQPEDPGSPYRHHLLQARIGAGRRRSPAGARRAQLPPLVLTTEGEISGLALEPFGDKPVAGVDVDLSQPGAA